MFQPDILQPYMNTQQSRQPQQQVSQKQNRYSQVIIFNHKNIQILKVSTQINEKRNPNTLLPTTINTKLQKINSQN